MSKIMRQLQEEGRAALEKTAQRDEREAFIPLSSERLFNVGVDLAAGPDQTVEVPAWVSGMTWPFPVAFEAKLRAQKIIIDHAVAVADYGGLAVIPIEVMCDGYGSADEAIATVREHRISVRQTVGGIVIRRRVR